MSVTVSLPPEDEARLQAKARQSGTTPEELVRQAISSLLASVPDENPALGADADPDRALDDVLESLPTMPSLSDQALSRECMYASEDETR